MKSEMLVYLICQQTQLNMIQLPFIESSANKKLKQQFVIFQ